MPMASWSYVRPTKKILWYRVFSKFDNMTSYAYRLVLNRFLAMITYWTNLILPLVFAANNIVKAASFSAY